MLPIYKLYNNRDKAGRFTPYVVRGKLHKSGEDQRREGVLEMAKNPQGFNYRGRRYTYVVQPSLTTREAAEEKVRQRRELAPQFLWAVNKGRNGLYGYGRASRSRSSERRYWDGCN